MSDIDIAAMRARHPRTSPARTCARSRAAAIPSPAWSPWPLAAGLTLLAAWVAAWWLLLPVVTS